MEHETEEILRKAGWHNGYIVPESSFARWKQALGQFPFHAAAERALRRFGGIRVGVQGPGETISREPIELNPLLLEGEEDYLEEESNRLGKRLFPLGEGCGGHYYLAIADDGRVYALIAGVGMISEKGSTIEEALDNLLLGRTCKPSLSDSNDSAAP